MSPKTLVFLLTSAIFFIFGVIWGFSILSGYLVEVSYNIVMVTLPATGFVMYALLERWQKTSYSLGVGGVMYLIGIFVIGQSVVTLVPVVFMKGVLWLMVAMVAEALTPR